MPENKIKLKEIFSKDKIKKHFTSTKEKIPRISLKTILINQISKFKNKGKDYFKESNSKHKVIKDANKISIKEKIINDLGEPNFKDKKTYQDIINNNNIHQAIKKEKGDVIKNKIEKRKIFAGLKIAGLILAILIIIFSSLALKKYIDLNKISKNNSYLMPIFKTNQKDLIITKKNKDEILTGILNYKNNALKNEINDNEIKEIRIIHQSLENENQKSLTSKEILKITDNSQAFSGENGILKELEDEILIGFFKNKNQNHPLLILKTEFLDLVKSNLRPNKEIKIREFFNDFFSLNQNLSNNDFSTINIKNIEIRVIRDDLERIIFGYFFLDKYIILFEDNSYQKIIEEFK